MDAAEWLTAYAARLGVAAPDETEREQLLALAGIAAHASERVAAPLACWMAARAGVSPADALVTARKVVPDGD